MNLILINKMMNHETSMGVSEIWQLFRSFLFAFQLNICISCLLPGTSVTNWTTTVEAIERRGQFRTQTIRQTIGARGDRFGSNLQF